MFQIPLKAKYRNPGRLQHRTFDPPEGTRTFTAGGGHSSKSSNSGQGSQKRQTLTPRKKSYFCGCGGK